ncbi:MAG: hypothetical protein EHM34_09685 [Nitrosopumilales archaeon]|nr:MAG: hypothetical protein EHM34_09685 [Nitrosopumilales archaeon]
MVHCFSSVSDLRYAIQKHGVVKYVNRTKSFTKELTGVIFQIDNPVLHNRAINMTTFNRSCIKEAKKLNKKIVKDITSRQLVIDFMPLSPKDLPSCFVSAQFLLNALTYNIDMYVDMRSCDVENKLANDIIMYSLLFDTVLKGTLLQKGELNIWMKSAHVYI